MTSNLTILPKVSKLSPRVMRILGCNPGPMTLQGTNTYLLGSGSRRILFDTGDGQQAEYFLNLKKSLNFDRLTIENIIISHWHQDHIGGVKEALNIGSSDCKVFKFPRSDLPANGGQLDVNFNPLVDGQTFQVEGATLTAVHTPGHTTDHICLHLKEEDAILSGDCILGEGTAVFEDLFTYMQSLSRLIELNPRVIYPGHGPVIHDPVQRLKYHIQHRNEREKQILDVLVDSPINVKDIVSIVYKDTQEHLHSAAAVNVTHHLDKLKKEGKVIQVGDLYKKA